MPYQENQPTTGEHPDKDDFPLHEGETVEQSPSDEGVVPSVKEDQFFPGKSPKDNLQKILESLKSLDENEKNIRGSDDPGEYEKNEKGVLELKEKKDSEEEKKRLLAEATALYEKITGNDLDEEVRKRLGEVAIIGDLKEYKEKVLLNQEVFNIQKGDREAFKEYFIQTLSEDEKKEIGIKKPGDIKGGLEEYFQEYLNERRTAFEDIADVEISETAFIRAIREGYKLDEFVDGRTAGFWYHIKRKLRMPNMEVPMANGESLFFWKQESMEEFAYSLQAYDEVMENEAHARIDSVILGGKFLNQTKEQINAELQKDKELEFFVQNPKVDRDVFLQKTQEERDKIILGSAGSRKEKEFEDEVSQRVRLNDQIRLELKRYDKAQYIQAKDLLQEAVLSNGKTRTHDVNEVHYDDENPTNNEKKKKSRISLKSEAKDLPRERSATIEARTQKIRPQEVLVKSFRKFLKSHPPIEEIFNPAEELNRVKKLSLRQREKALDAFKEKLVLQQEALAECRAFIEQEIESNPDADPKLLSGWVKEFGKNYGFTNEQKDKALALVEEYYKERKNVKVIIEDKEKYPTRVSLVNYLTGLNFPDSEEDKFEIIVGPMSVDIITTKKNMVKIYDENEEVPLVTVTRAQYAGFSSRTKTEPPVYYTVLDKYSKRNLEGTLEHEREHAKNSLLGKFFERQFTLKEEAQLLGEYRESGEEEKLKEYFTYKREEAFGNIKDEILAMLRDFAIEGLESHTKDLLLSGQSKSYDYLKDVREPKDFKSDALYKAVAKKMLVNEYDATINQAVRALVELVTRGGYSEERAAALLMDKNLKFWKVNVDRLIEQKSKKK